MAMKPSSNVVLSMSVWNVLLVVVLSLALAACGSSPTNEPENLEASQRAKAADARLQAATGYIESGQLERAKGHLDKAMQHQPDNANVQSTMGYYYSLVGENELADKHFEKALKLAPKNPAVLDLYGVYLCRQGKYSKAQELFERAMAVPSNSQMASVLENAGLCAVRSQATAKAEEYFRRALQHNPKQPQALLEMANSEFQYKRYERAKSYWDRYEAVGGNTPRSLWVGIQIAHVLSDKDKVASLGLKLEQLFPDSEEAGLYADKKQQWRK